MYIFKLLIRESENNEKSNEKTLHLDLVESIILEFWLRIITPMIIVFCIFGSSEHIG